MSRPVCTSFVDLAEATPGEAVVVIDVLRAFTTVPLLFDRGASEVLATDQPQTALDLAVELAAGGRSRVVLAGEDGGRRLEGFDLGNSPTEIAATDLGGATVIHRTSAGTQGLMACVGSRWLFAGSFGNAASTAAAVRATAASRITFVITGASLGRDGDEDLACAELIAARLRGDEPDARPFLDRVPRSDAGRVFAPGGPDWAPPSDLDAACALDRYGHALAGSPAWGGRAVELRPTAS